MRGSHLVVLVVILAGSCSCLFGATPAQTGAWLGTVKKTIYFSGGKRTETSQLLFNIAADDTTTVTVNGVQWTTVANYTNVTDGVLVLIDDSVAGQNTTALPVFHFTPKTIKGNWNDFTESEIGGEFIESSESKFTLKKLGS
jgi:hypothetical protein